MKQLLIIVITFLTLSSKTAFCRGIVCNEEELIAEINEDLLDNGLLDCLRESIPMPGENEEEAAKRKNANWTGDCSFEANGWESDFFKSFGLSGLVDAHGNMYKSNNPAQADMCEIVRTLMFIFAKSAGQSDPEAINGIAKDLTTLLDCPGSISTSTVCAATDGEFNDKEKWQIFLSGAGLSFNGSPSYKAISN